jgi:hypothetical protein
MWFGWREGNLRPFPVLAALGLDNDDENSEDDR